MGDCPFCARIAAGEYDYEDRHAVGFQPLNPVTPGHWLAVPKKHVASALVSPLEASRAMAFAAEMSRLMELDACNFITSAGAAATQTVPHLHIHVVPRHEGDGLALPWTGQQTAQLGLTSPVDALWPGGTYRHGAIATRTRNRLQRAGFTTAGDVAACTEHDLLHLREFGHGQLREVERALAAAGLGLREAAS